MKWLMKRISIGQMVGLAVALLLIVLHLYLKSRFIANNGLLVFLSPWWSSSQAVTSLAFFYLSRVCALVLAPFMLYYIIIGIVMGEVKKRKISIRN